MSLAKEFSRKLIIVAGVATMVIIVVAGIAAKDLWAGRLTPGSETSVLSAIQDQDESSLNDPPGTKRVRLDRYKNDDPARVALVMEGDTDVTPGDRPFKPWQGKPFVAGDDWVKNLKVVLKNLSNKKIVAASISVNFPESDDPAVGLRFVGYDVTVGRTPARYVRVGGSSQGELRPASGSAPLNIGTSQELTVALADYYDKIKDSVETVRPISGTKTCWILIGRVYFDDGTTWSHGEFQKPDPVSPGRYIKITADEFWGRTPRG